LKAIWKCTGLTVKAGVACSRCGNFVAGVIRGPATCDVLSERGVSSLFLR